MLKCLLLREVSEVCIFQQTRLANAYLKRGFLESIGLWGDEVSHIPIRKVTAHLLEGLLWTGVYCQKLTGVWIDWAQQATSQCSVWLLSTAEFCEVSFRGKFSSENGSQLLYSWSEPPIHSQHECYSFIDNSVHEFSLVTSFFESLSTALSVTTKLTLNVLRNESQFEIWGSYFEVILYPLVPKLTPLAYWIPILLELWFWSTYSGET